MRIVLDTSIFVSALLKATSVPAIALRLVQHRHTLLTSEATEQELRLVLARPKISSYMAPSANLWLDQTLQAAELIQISDHVAACRDRRHDTSLQLAVNGHADLMLSGDADLLTMTRFRAIPIIAAAAFITTRWL